MLRDALVVIGAETDYIFNNEESFSERFVKADYWTLTEVSFTNKRVNFVYIHKHGERIADSITIDEYIDWVNSKCL